MKGTALLINKDHSVSILENIEHEVYEELMNQKDAKSVTCTIDDKEIQFAPISKVVWYEGSIDWAYGY